MANSSERIRGEEVTITIVQDSNVQDTLNSIMNFNGELEFEIKDQGYLGELANRQDYIYKSAKFDFEMHTYTQDWITFVEAVQAKGNRTQPDTQFNIGGDAVYANGDNPTFLFADCAFGNIPFNTPSRTEYVKHKFQGSVASILFTKS